MAVIFSRYGASYQITDPNDPWIIRRLIQDLRTEQHDEPDDEHDQVSVGNDRWGVTAQVSGLITLERMDQLDGKAATATTRHLRDIPDEQLVLIWQAIVRDDDDALLGQPWQSLDELPPPTTDYYRSEEDDDEDDEWDDEEDEEEGDDLDD